MVTAATEWPMHLAWDDGYGGLRGSITCPDCRTAIPIAGDDIRGAENDARVARDVHRCPRPLTRNEQLAKACGLPESIVADVQRLRTQGWSDDRIAEAFFDCTAEVWSCLQLLDAGVLK